MMAKQYNVEVNLAAWNAERAFKRFLGVFSIFYRILQGETLILLPIVAFFQANERDAYKFAVRNGPYLKVVGLERGLFKATLSVKFIDEVLQCTLHVVVDIGIRRQLILWVINCFMMLHEPLLIVDILV